MTRADYEEQKRRLAEQHRALLEMVETAHQFQLRALEIVWRMMSGEGSAESLLPPAAPVRPPSPLHRPRLPLPRGGARRPGSSTTTSGGSAAAPGALHPVRRLPGDRLHARPRLSLPGTPGAEARGEPRRRVERLRQPADALPPNLEEHKGSRAVTHAPAVATPPTTVASRGRRRETQRTLVATRNHAPAPPTPALAHRPRELRNGPRGLRHPPRVLRNAISREHSATRRGGVATREGRNAIREGEDARGVGGDAGAGGGVANGGDPRAGAGGQPLVRISRVRASVACDLTLGPSPEGEGGPVRTGGARRVRCAHLRGRCGVHSTPYAQSGPELSSFSFRRRR